MQIGVRCTSMDGRLWRNLIYARIVFKYLLVQTANLKSEIYDEIRVLTIRTRRISNFYVPCLSIYPPSNALPTPSTCRSQTLSRLNLGKPRFNMNYSKTIWRLARSAHISPIAAPVWFSSTHNLVTWGIPSVERRTMMLNQVAYLVGVAYVNLRLPPTCL